MEVVRMLTTTRALQRECLPSFTGRRPILFLSLLDFRPLRVAIVLGCRGIVRIEITRSHLDPQRWRMAFKLTDDDENHIHYLDQFSDPGLKWGSCNTPSGGTSITNGLCADDTCRDRSFTEAATAPGILGYEARRKRRANL